MATLVQLLANYAGLIYIACIIGAAFYVREIIAARQELQQSLYSLEREAANSRFLRSIGMLGLIGLIAVVIYVLQTVVAPQIAAEVVAETPTAAFQLNTDTPTPTYQPTPTRTPRPPTVAPGTPTPAVADATPESPTPTPPPMPAESCPDPQVQITAPVAGQTFSSAIQIRGTASIPNFAFYKFTLNGPGTGSAEVTAGDVIRTPKQNDVLGSIDPAALLNQPGVYVLGLVAVDNTGNEAPHCYVPIVIQPAP
jgi:hypothetical protein